MASMMGMMGGGALITVSAEELVALRAIVEVGSYDYEEHVSNAEAAHRVVGMFNE